MNGAPKFTAQEFRDVAAAALATKDLNGDRGTLAAMCLFAADLVDHQWRRGQQTIGASPVLTHQTREPRIDLAVNEQHLQLRLDQARSVVATIVRAIESAATDELMFKFLTDRIGLDVERAGLAILELRELRKETKA